MATGDFQALKAVILLPPEQLGEVFRVLFLIPPFQPFYSRRPPEQE
jgi:hypothetical protein